MENNKETLLPEDLLNAKTYLYKGKDFCTSRELLESFFEFTSGLPYFKEYIIKVDKQVQNKNDDGTLNTSFGRAFITALLNEEKKGEPMSFGLTYQLDRPKPIATLFYGSTASSCTNLSIYDADHTEEVELKLAMDKISKAEKLKAFFAPAEEHYYKLIKRLTEFEQIKINKRTQLENLLGKVGISMAADPEKVAVEERDMELLRGGERKLTIVRFIV